MATNNLHWRKTTDINREHALFELLSGEISLIDVGFSDDGVFEISFNRSTGGAVLEWSQFLTLLDEGKALAEQDRT